LLLKKMGNKKSTSSSSPGGGSNHTSEDNNNNNDTSSPSSPSTTTTNDRRRSTRRSINNRPKSQINHPVPQDWPIKGSYVHVKLPDWSRYYGGEVKRVVEKNKIFDVLFDDGERITDVRIEEIRKPGVNNNNVDATIQRHSTNNTNEDEPRTPSRIPAHYRIGDRVSCRIPGWKQWYDGVVKAVNAENGMEHSTYVVEFDDGEIVSTVREKEMMKIIAETNKAAAATTTTTTDLVSPTPPSQSNNISKDFIKVGGRCEAKCEGWHKYYPGTLRAKDESTGLWEVMFDDGELRSDVAESMMRSARSQTSAVTFVDSTMPLVDDGKQTTTNNNNNSVTSVSSENDDNGDEFKPGTRVFANPKGEWTKMYPGTIERLLANGTVSILFDDGDRVVGVEKKDMTLARTRASSTGSGPSNEGDIPLRPGLLVEAKVGAWKKFYPGRIKAQSSNGTYVIEFLDGEIVEAVKKSEIRQPRARAETTATDVESTNQNDPNQKYNINDRVAAKLPHWRRYWGGYVTGINKDGTYAISFDDGEVYAAVHPSEMKIPEGHLAHPEYIEPEEKIYFIGDRVEAKLIELGWKAWYPGVVEFKNADGYGILFDDGDRFHDVQANEMRELI
jgi:hypothetical protein